MAVAINPEARIAAVVGSGTAAATSITSRLDTQRPCAYGVSPGVMIRAMPSAGKFPPVSA
jgi:hypothetical protein